MARDDRGQHGDGHDGQRRSDGFEPRRLFNSIQQAFANTIRGMRGKSMGARRWR
jgi:hypothetical protein